MPKSIRQTDQMSGLPGARPLLRPVLRVLDVGCGTGWFSNSLAYHHGALVTGLDFNPVAVERAREVAAAMNLPTEFAVGDLFPYEPSEPFDLVVSIGVLHHTDNCSAALRRVCTEATSNPVDTPSSASITPMGANRFSTTSRR